MLFGRKKVDLAELPLEQVRFSAQDLFTLMGGFDLGMVACNTHNLDGDAVMRRQAHKGPWRRDLVNRYQASGWVDAEGNPNEELGRMVRLISSPGVVVMNDKYEEGTAEVVTDGEAACGVVKAQGFRGGYFLKPFPADKSLWEARFQEIFPPDQYPLAKANWDLHAAVAPREDEAKELPELLGDRDIDGLRAYAGRHGVPEGALMDLVNGLGGLYRLYVDDTRGSTFGTGQGMSNPLDCRGRGAIKRMWVVPRAGCTLNGCDAWHPGVPEDWASHVEEDEYKRLMLFYGLDFSSRGSLWELCMRPFDVYPERDIVDLEGGPSLLDQASRE